jgi:hypothetical protein
MSGENGESGVEHHKVTVVQVLYDHETCVVELGLEGVKLGLAQMMIHEAAVQLDIMRRQAATMEMLQQRASAAATQDLVNKLRNGR